MNQWIQSKRQELGELGSGTRLANGHVRIGDRVVFRENDQDLGVANGDFGTVQVVLGKRLFVRLDRKDLEGRPIDISVSLRSYKKLELGYAVTAHRAQGATVDVALVLASDPFVLDRETWYVAATRARKEVKLHLSELTAGRELAEFIRSVSRSRREKLAVEVARDLRRVNEQPEGFESRAEQMRAKQR